MGDDDFRHRLGRTGAACGRQVPSISERDDRQELPASDSAEWTRVVQCRYDPTEGTLATTLVFAVAEAMEIDPTEVRSPPLYDCIDATALERTFFGTRPSWSPPNATGAVHFHYRDYLVKVRSDGHVGVYAPVVPR